jgi:hypothetical protein
MSSAGEVMRLKGNEGSVLLQTFLRQEAGAWKEMTTWSTIVLKPNYAEFRQRSEPDGLWLSLSLKNGQATLISHNGITYHSPQDRVIYRKLSSAESKKITGLPE